MDQNTGLRIFVVDDSKEDHFFIKEGLKDFNIYFQSFYDGEEFYLHMLNKKNDPTYQHPDIVILDINMPKLTGFEVYEKMIKDDLQDNIKFFILTTTLSDRDKERGVRLGIDCYTKPFSISEFSKLLQELIKKYM